MKTNDVINGEDRRHQVGYAPLVTVQQRTREVRLSGPLEGRTVSTQYMVLYNQGFGIATNVRVFFPGIAEPQQYRILAVHDETDFRLADGVQNGQLILKYLDMFGNEYTTTYAAIGNYGNYDWLPPMNLQPSEHRSELNARLA